MSFLETLTNAEKDTLVSLPYRAGLWVSQSDDAGGAESSALELQTLSNIINGFARDIFGAEMMQHVMAETLAQQERWPEWALKMDSVVDDCGRAVDLVRTHGDAKDVNAFQNHILEIGEAVAMAFSEYQGEGGLSQILLKASFYIENFKAGLAQKKKKTMREFLSVSPKERDALSALARALGTEY